MYCSKCGNEVQDDWRVCPYCENSLGSSAAGTGAGDYETYSTVSPLSDAVRRKYERKSHQGTCSDDGGQRVQKTTGQTEQKVNTSDVKENYEDSDRITAPYDTYEGTADDLVHVPHKKSVFLKICSGVMVAVCLILFFLWRWDAFSGKEAGLGGAGPVKMEPLSEINATPTSESEGQNTEEEAGGNLGLVSEGPDIPDINEAVSKDDDRYVTIEDFLELDSVEFTYTGYETRDSYPDGDEPIFTISAVEGKKLLVLKFLAQNTSGADIEIDIHSSNTRFRIIVDDEEKNALATLLLNDLQYYRETLAPNEGVELVLLCEIPDGQVSQISSLGIVMRNEERTATILLN